MSASAAVLSTPQPFKPGRDYNHADDAEYARLRGLAQAAYKARSRCYDDAHEAYQRGDGAEAKRLSELGKKHDAEMDDYNAQAAAFVFRANNADSDADEIDLHGLYVNEAEEYLRQRIQACKARNEDHLEVIVGKGNHSVNGVAKLKPAVERLCQENNFQYAVDEHNLGVVIINFRQSGGYQPMSSMPVQPKKGRHNNSYTSRPDAAYSPSNVYPAQAQPQYTQQQQSNHGQQSYPGHPQQQFQMEQQQQQKDENILMVFFKCFVKCLS
ncbi:uncharacterized protein V1518DRAFT_408432 [Limtongia smithiae]|uniref:uncharacterized protein n=1 Tax=Limtongia smithiae TaxID=1125753 RepID=UPI0034CD46FA